MNYAQTVRCCVCPVRLDNCAMEVLSTSGAPLPATIPDATDTFTDADAGVHTWAGLVFAQAGPQRVAVRDTGNFRPRGARNVTVAAP